MRCILISTALISMGSKLYGQSSESHDPNEFRIKAGVLAETLIHPGFIVGIEKNIWSNLKQKYNEKRMNPKRRKRAILKEFYWGGTLGGYNHPNNETLLFVSGKIGYQRSSSKGSIWAIDVGLGGYRTFNNIPTYELSGSKYKKVALAGWGGLMPSASVAWGWNAWLKKNKYWSFKVGPMAYLRTSYNHTTVASGGIIAEIIIHDLF